MQIWRQVDPAARNLFQGGSIVIGNFDGLHLGHQALLAAAADYPGPHIVITFDPHPVQVLQPERGLKRLFPREDLAEILPSRGVDLLVILPFTKEFAQLEPEDFLEGFVGPLRPRHIVAGYDFVFGRERHGSLERLRAWAGPRGAQVDVVSAITFSPSGEPVSSGRLRELIGQGKVAEAAALLGRPFYLRGRVGSGAGRGGGLGFPTLNQEVVNETLPAVGVYATRTRWRGSVFASVTNVGHNPTFGEGGSLKVETHVLVGECAARGETVDVEFVAYLRPEKKFASSAELARQIQDDIRKAKEVLGVR